MGWVVNATPRQLYLRERPGTYCIGGWVGQRAGLYRCGKSRPDRDSIPDSPARSKSLYRLSYLGPKRQYFSNTKEELKMHNRDVVFGLCFRYRNYKQVCSLLQSGLEA
jgi:hypothetical protein